MSDHHDCSYPEHLDLEAKVSELEATIADCKTVKDFYLGQLRESTERVSQLSEALEWALGYVSCNTGGSGLHIKPGYVAPEGHIGGPRVEAHEILEKGRAALSTRQDPFIPAPKEMKEAAKRALAGKPVQSAQDRKSFQQIRENVDAIIKRPPTAEQLADLDATLRATQATCVDCWANVSGHCPKCGAGAIQDKCIGLDKAHVDGNCPACSTSNDNEREKS